MNGIGGDATIWLILIVAAVLFLFLPQWLARRKETQKMATLEVGQRVLTIGGFIGQLTYIDREHNMARIKLAEGMEANILLNAIARPLPETSVVEETPEPESEADSDSDSDSES